MKYNSSNKGVCKLCKTKFVGRSDKMFCSVKCKSIYSYRLRSVTKVATQEIDKILHRNRSILLEILGKNKVQTKIERSLLDRKKFNFSYITHYHINNQGKTVHYLYDFSWMIFSDQEILIKRIRRQRFHLASRSLIVIGVISKVSNLCTAKSFCVVRGQSTLQNNTGGQNMRGGSPSGVRGKLSKSLSISRCQLSGLFCSYFKMQHLPAELVFYDRRAFSNTEFRLQRLDLDYLSGLNLFEAMTKRLPRRRTEDELKTQL